MKWDLSALPQDAIIQEATLSLYMHGYGGDDNSYDGSNSWTGGANG